MRQPEVEEFDWDQQVLPRPEPLFLLARPLRLGPLASTPACTPACVRRQGVPCHPFSVPNSQPLQSDREARAPMQAGDGGVRCVNLTPICNLTLTLSSTLGPGAAHSS